MRKSRKNIAHTGYRYSTCLAELFRSRPRRRPRGWTWLAPGACPWTAPAVAVSLQCIRRMQHKACNAHSACSTCIVCTTCNTCNACSTHKHARHRMHTVHAIHTLCTIHVIAPHVAVLGVAEPQQQTFFPIICVLGFSPLALGSVGRRSRGAAAAQDVGSIIRLGVVWGAGRVRDH